MSGEPRQTDDEPRYFVLSVDVPAAAADLFSGVLFQLGARGLETVPAEGLMLFPGVERPRPGKERLRATFVDQGPEARIALERNLCRHLAAVPPELQGPAASSTHFETVEPADWSKLWRSFFKPLQIGERLFLRPSWERAAVPDGRIELVIDPGLAFGNGGHETTRMCLEWVEAHVAGRSLLDVGTGTGVLALAAVRLGATRILATDNDPTALEVARSNVEANDALGRLELTSRSLEAIEERFECIVANIIASTLVGLAADLAARLVPEGRVALSGVLVEQEDAVLAAFAKAGLAEVERRRCNDWSLLHLRRLDR